jgi:hypothetical protein
MQQGLCSALQQQQQQQQQHRWRPALDASSQVPERAAASCMHCSNCCRSRGCSVAAAVAAVALGRRTRHASCCHSRGSGRCVACATSCRQSHGRHGRAAVAAMAAATACAAAAALLQPRLQLLHAPGQLLPQPQQRPLHAPRPLRYRRRQQLHARRDSCSHSHGSSRCMQFCPAGGPPEPASDAAVGASRAAMHACARFTSPSAACTTSRRVHEDSTVSLPQSQPPCTPRAAIFGTPWDISGSERSFGTAASCICRVAGVILCQMQGGGGGNCTIGQQGSSAAATDAICGAAPCAIVLLGPFTPGAAEMCSGRRLASRRVCCARIVSPSAVRTAADDDTKDSIAPLSQPGQQPPLHLARGVTRHAAGHFRRREQLWVCSRLHRPCRWGNSAVRCRCRQWRNTQSGSRAAAASAIHRAAPCAIVPPGRLTPGTDELCSGRRLASRRVCCAR